MLFDVAVFFCIAKFHMDSIFGILPRIYLHLNVGGSPFYNIYFFHVSVKFLSIYLAVAFNKFLNNQNAMDNNSVSTFGSCFIVVGAFRYNSSSSKVYHHFIFQF